MKGELRLGSLVNALLTSILIILFIILVFMMSYGVTGRIVPVLVVKTGSMEPVLNIGDVIIIDDSVRPEEIKAGPDGDIIVFRKPGSSELIVHRAIGKTSEGFITKGDANPGIDFWSPVPYENLVGRWTGLKIPYWTGVGFLSLFLRGEIYPPYGRIVLVLLIVLNLFLIIRDFRSRKRGQSSSEPPREASPEES